jgi:CheY-like chemotaxis protein
MRPFPILHVEDDENDVFLLKLAFERVGMVNPIHLARDGQEAIDYLSGQGKFSDRSRHPLPCLLLLDLKLPVKMGLDVLKWVREHPKFRKLLVVILSASAQVADVERAYELGVNSFLVKPTGVEKREALARLIKEYWLNWNQAPAACGGVEGTATALEKSYSISGCS